MAIFSETSKCFTHSRKYHLFTIHIFSKDVFAPERRISLNDEKSGAILKKKYFSLRKDLTLGIYLALSCDMPRQIFFEQEAMKDFWFSSV